jgi:phosphoglycerate dehydrogenase-like enzyme
MGQDGRLVVATQLDGSMQRKLQSRLHGVEWRTIPRGAPASLDADVEVLFAHVFPADPDSPLRQRPQGWPYSLRWVQLVSAGVDGYPEWLLEVPLVTTARGVTSEPIAEFVLAVLLAHAKRLPHLWIDRPDDWQHTSLAMLRDSTLGLVGFGAIGQAIAAKAQALGMRVLAHRRTDSPLPIPNVERAETLQALFSRCDHVVLAAPATAESRHMIGDEVLAHAKEGLHLVNVSRGGLVDQDALLRALDSGRLAGATLDVTEPEPLPAGHPFYSHPKVKLSPHTSSISEWSSEALVRKFEQNVERFTRGETLGDIWEASRGY